MVTHPSPLQVIAFLRKKDGFIGLVLKHMDTSAMMDLVLRLISCVEPAPLREEVLNWLNEEELIQRLVELIRVGQDEERQSNASQTLCDMIRLSRDQASQVQETVEPDPLLAVLESQETVEELLKNMFEVEKSESCILNGTQVLLTLLETRRPGGFERSYTVNSGVLRGIEPHLKDFQQVLLDPPKKSAMLTTIGLLEDPLGNARLHVARLVASLLQSSTPSISQELCHLDTMALLLDLFFKYTWNNFLHFQVELCVAAILNHSAQEEKPQARPEKEEEEQETQEEGRTQNSTPGTPETSAHSILVANLFQKCRLMQRILDAWEENDKIQAEGGMRRGYMGHLTRIANNVVQNMDKGPIQAQISDLIKDLPEDCRGRWESFVDETLTDTNRRNTVDLVSTHHLHSSSEDDDMESPFPNEMSLQQAFSDYQIQQMTANFVDQFGFNDEEFAEHDENINATFDRIAEINFSLDADDHSANSAAFEACCKERIQQFDDNEEEEDIWEDEEINYATKVKSRMRFGVSRTSDSSSRSDVENGEQDQSCGSDEEEEGPKDSTNTENDKNKSQTEGNESEFPEATGQGWTASFEDMVNAKAPAPCVVVDVGASVWDTHQNNAGESEDKGWATFSDFQPFCCSESGPRCSSPVGLESTNSEGCPKKTQDKNFKSPSPCTWTVCASRTAPLVASDSSSSGGSDSEEEEEKANVVTETIAAGAGKETVKLSAEAKNEKAVPKSSDADSVPIDKLSVADGPQRGTETPNRTEPPAAPPPITSATECPATNLTVTDRKGEILSPAEPSLNGPA
ncbi:hypothetical protein SKAU_G00040450 [Synaphobranchus kaupii]|uniref:Serine/threonine-protein phosphatase 6 regulatory subunit 2 n=1 Tax=Synaphobranchus kaupii TaxID=118154 RepID=A0A9Q1G167_SYNKA|nr:hypothetical protein SKAU_G00040450 [Synaphobranchus kaupii]